MSDIIQFPQGLKFINGSRISANEQGLQKWPSLKGKIGTILENTIEDDLSGQKVPYILVEWDNDDIQIRYKSLHLFEKVP